MIYDIFLSSIVGLYDHKDLGHSIPVLVFAQQILQIRLSLDFVESFFFHRRRPIFQRDFTCSILKKTHKILASSDEKMFAIFLLYKVKRKSDCKNFSRENKLRSPDI